VRRKNPPFRAEHVGSLKRPESLQEARIRLLGPHSSDSNLGPHHNRELRAIEDDAIRESVWLQEEAGLKDITDGELRRHTWWTDFFLGLEGVRENKGVDSPIHMVDKSGHSVRPPSIAVFDKIRWTGPVAARDFAFLKGVTERTPKTSIPAPMDLHYLIGGSTNISADAYPDIAVFLEDLVTAYQQEIAALAAAGCRYLQLDDVTFGLLCDPTVRSQKVWGFDPDELLRLYVGTFNRAVSCRPDDMTLAIHICRGNRSGHWGAEGGYDPVAEVLFNKLDVDAYFLEYDTPRAGSFAPLRFVPSGKTVVLGLVTTKDPTLRTHRRFEAADRCREFNPSTRPIGAQSSVWVLLQLSRKPGHRGRSATKAVSGRAGCGGHLGYGLSGDTCNQNTLKRTNASSSNGS
jgi:5-methyltetrahydropteroyltriglutamate--homocysteine methyltransferase